jgi:hypothetical protein
VADAPSLTQLGAATEALEASWAALDELLITRPPGTVDPRLLYRTKGCARDIIAGSLLLADAHRVAAAAVAAESAIVGTRFLARKPPSGEDLEADAETTRRARAATVKLGAAYKAAFYLVRAYQDTVYRMILNLQKRDWWGPNASMQRAITNEKKVGVLLRDRLPEYLEWFVEWREKRNRIKDGVVDSWTGPETDLGLVFSELLMKADGTTAVVVDGGKAIRLGDVVRAVEFSARLTALLKPVVAERMAVLASPPPAVGT